MTTTSPSSRTRRPARTAAPAFTRALTWSLHLLLTLLAIFSLFTTRFDLWIDLRFLPAFAQSALKILWTATALLLPFAAGPHLGGLRKPRWLNHPLIPNSRLLFLLLPSYALLAILLLNVITYFRLLHRNVVGISVPYPLAAFLLLAATLLFTHRWSRISRKLPAATPASRLTQLFAAAVTFPAAALMLALFSLHLYSNPPQQPVDLAVVFGNRVLPDGSASPELRDRTLAAIDLYRRGLAKHLLLSGGFDDVGLSNAHQLSEVAAMRQVCLDHGIPDSAISLDPLGADTRATAFNTRTFMHSHHLSSVVACSSDDHLPRIALAFRQYGLASFTVPAPRTPEYPCASLQFDLRELLGLLVYKFDPSYHSPKAALMQLIHPRIVVQKSANTLELFDGNALVKTYPCITGGNPGDKEKEGDRRTPLGTFHIVFKNPQSKFHLSLGLDYPNAEDAARGLRDGLITKAQYDQILAALKTDLSLPENQQKLWYTPLGGEIFLHGHAEGRSNTAGCVALANPDIEELFAILPVGTPVEIKP